jgi:hypothetical protein
VDSKDCWYIGGGRLAIEAVLFIFESWNAKKLAIHGLYQWAARVAKSAPFL